MFKLLKKMKIENCTFDKEENSCFMYDLKNNGIGYKLLANSFDGRMLLVYQYNTKLFRGKKYRKCPWCNSVVRKIEEHIVIKHNKRSQDMFTYKMQRELYALLLKKIRKGHYLATSYTNELCVFCDDPVAEEREGLCSRPESARNKVMSFRVMGFGCDGFKKRWYEEDDICYIIL